MNKRIWLLWCSVLIIFPIAALSLVGCTSAATTTPAASSLGPGGGAVVQSDSIINGQIKAIRQPSEGFPWELDVLVNSSEDVGGLPNPTKDHIGQVITVKADQDLSAFKAGEGISARVKYAGDVPKPGIFLYIYDVKAQ